MTLFDSRAVITAMVLLAAASVVANIPVHAAGNAVEIGAVEWGRDLDAALEASRKTGKPVFAFFQEVPGCGGCQKFGAEVMSYPPIVEAVEREFLPVLIYNNRRGRDQEILELYQEPAWNYQVIRFLDAEGQDLIPRKDRVWTRDALAARMIQVLEVTKRPVPPYLEVVAYESDAESLEKAAFAQSCFWSGEVALGGLPGVITTEAGWMEGREVTLVRYRPDLVSLETLVGRAATAGVADKLYLPTREQRRRFGDGPRLKVGKLDSSYRRADESDQKRQIRESAFWDLELSAMQQTKINAFVTVDMQQALAWLTSEQRAELERLETRP
jgi:hypothetical protein